MNQRSIPQRFQVSFSFAGEQRSQVRSIAKTLEERLGPNTVFVDEWYEHLIAGSDADEWLQQLYGEQSDLVVLCLSADYTAKRWTRAEHEAIRDLNMRLRGSGDPRDRLRILPLKLGNGEPSRIPFNTVYVDGRTKSAEDIVEIILRRLASLRPRGPAGAGPTGHGRRIFLAEVTPDLDDRTKPVNRDRVKSFLQSRGWSVLPDADYSEDEYRERLGEDLASASAFVQLRGRYPWKRGDFDRLQHATAVKAGLKTLIYRSSDIDLPEVEPEAHRAFLAAPEVIATGFDDFLVFLEKELEGLLQPPPLPHGAQDPPLVRVVTRSKRPDELWERVFEWVFVEEKILSDHLAPDESLEAKHEKEPCQGFLIVCDSAAMDDGPLSPRQHIEQCRTIQMREKNPARRPAVGLVYWPPPAPSWPKLLQCQTLNMYYAAADAVARQKPQELGNFFSAVRRVAR
jgi:hypothetical protein